MPVRTGHYKHVGAHEDELIRQWVSDDMSATEIAALLKREPITLESEPLPQKERSRGVTVSSVLGGWEETAHGSLGGLGGALCWPGRGRHRGGGPAAATA